MKGPAPGLVVLDWGIGGLSVYNELRKRLPRASILYHSDSGTTPYGKMSRTELRDRVREVILGYAERGTFHFVVACNAASTALPSLAEGFADRGLHVVGVIEFGVALIRAARFRNVGVIGGRRTILSRHYTRPFSGHRVPRVTGRIAQPLSALIERGELDGAEMRRELAAILEPLRSCDALVLACTHYPAIAPLIAKILPRCALLDPAEATARAVARAWRLPRAEIASTVYVTTGDPRRMIRAARLAFGNRIERVVRVRTKTPRPAFCF